MKKRPHIIIFNPDEMRWDTMGHMGNPAASTPFLDRFAETEAVSIDRCYCQNPVCVPSRCSFATGLYPHVFGHRTMAHLLRPHEKSMFQELREAGYYVWMNTRNDLAAGQYEGWIEAQADEIYHKQGLKNQIFPEVSPEEEGNVGERWQEAGKEAGSYPYSFYTGLSEGKADADIEDVWAAIERIKGIGELDQPLCLFLGLLNPHPEYTCQEPWFSRIDREQVPDRIRPEECEGKPYIEELIRHYQELEGLSEDAWTELRATYLAQCAKIDWLFEQLCNALKEAGIYEDTAIFFFSDHGDFAGDYGLSEKAQNTFEDCLTRVPLLIKLPQGYPIEPGRRDTLAELVDFYATAMELAGVEPTHDQFGVSLLPVLANKEASVRAYAHSEGGRMAWEWQSDEYHADTADTVATSPENHYYPKQKAQSDPLGHTKGTMTTDGRYKYVHRTLGSPEFYDLEKDAGERHNEINNPAYAKEIARFRLELLDWYQSTCDIVPRDKDRRFSNSQLWNMVSKRCLPENEETVKRLIREGAAMGTIMAAAAKKAE